MNKEETIIQSNNEIMKMAHLLCRDYQIVLQTRQFLQRSGRIHFLDQWIDLAIRDWIQHCPCAKILYVQYPQLFPMMQVTDKTQKLDILLFS